MLIFVIRVIFPGVALATNSCSSGEIVWQTKTNNGTWISFECIQRRKIELISNSQPIGDNVRERRKFRSLSRPFSYSRAACFNGFVVGTLNWMRRRTQRVLVAWIRIPQFLLLPLPLLLLRRRRKLEKSLLSLVGVFSSFFFVFLLICEFVSFLRGLDVWLRTNLTS